MSFFFLFAMKWVWDTKKKKGLIWSRQHHPKIIKRTSAFSSLSYFHLVSSLQRNAVSLHCTQARTFNLHNNHAILQSLYIYMYTDSLYCIHCQAFNLLNWSTCSSEARLEEPLINNAKITTNKCGDATLPYARIICVSLSKCDANRQNWFGVFDSYSSWRLL